MRHEKPAVSFCLVFRYLKILTMGVRLCVVPKAATKLLLNVAMDETTRVATLAT